MTAAPSDVEAALEKGDMSLLDRMPYSSNATFLVEIRHGEDRLRAIYKPARGERPLWDFPEGLHQREAAAYLLSRSLGWDLVPETVVRDGELGEGSVQRFVEADLEQHYFTLVDQDRHHDQLRRACVFDLLANSTDRKGGHLLIDGDDHIWAIDNGLSFHSEFKLRTVIWDFAGEPIPAVLTEPIKPIADGDLAVELAEVLSPLERDALQTRARALIREATFPHDQTGRRWPWPVV